MRHLKKFNELYDSETMRDKYTDLTPIENEDSTSRKGYINIPYKEIVEKVFTPNIARHSDIKDSWAFQDEQDRKAFIWSYRHTGKLEDCKTWSIDGNMDLLERAF